VFLVDLVLVLGIILKKVMLNRAVDFRSRRFAFREAGAESAGVYAPSTTINRVLKINIQLELKEKAS
jgi:hypothetical protein